MNAVEVLRPPWIASPRSSRWLALVLCVALAVAEVAELLMLGGRARMAAAGVTWCCALGLWWLLVVPSALWLARDATALQLPQARRLANASVLTYALLTVVVPATMLALVLGHALLWYVGFMLAVITCMLFLLLPSGVLLAFWFAFVAITSVHPIHFPFPGVDRLALYGIAPALALAALAVWQWFRVLGMPAPAGVGLGKPVIWNMHIRARSGFLGVFSRSADAAMARGAYAWLLPMVDLRRVGPGHPVGTIRVALGRNLMPQTAASRLRTTGLVVAFLALVLSPTIMQALHGGWRHALDALVLNGSSGGFSMAGMLTTVLPIVTMLSYSWPTRHRWIEANNELALLGLLPRLGDAATQRRSAAVACLVKVGYIAAFECVALYAIGLWIGMPMVALPFAILCGAATLALAAVPVLGALGGRRVSGWLVLALTIITVGVGATAVTLIFQAHGGTDARTVGYLALALVILVGVLVALGWRGWQALQHRPHPFLGTAP